MDFTAMSSTFVQVATGVGRKALIATVLIPIGLVVGFGCVLLPPAIPFAIVGIAAMLLFWTMPELRSVPDRWSRNMVYVFLFVSTCVPTYYAIILPGLPWISIRRAVLFAWLAPLFVLISGSSTARTRIVDKVRSSPLLFVCVTGYMLVVYATLPTADNLSASLGYVLSTSTLFWFLPLIGVVVCVNNLDAIKKLCTILIYASFINFVIGLIERILQKPFLVYALPPDMREQIFAANGILEYNLSNGHGFRGGVYRASSTFTTALTWGENCAMLVPFCLHLIMYGRTAFNKALGATGVVICIASISLTGSRGAYSSMAVGVVCYAMIWALRASLLHPGRLLGKISLTLGAMASVAFFLSVQFVGRVHTIFLGGGGDHLSNDARALQWELAKPKILAHPIFGYGAGAAGGVIGYWSSHNYPSVDGYYMNLLVDHGIFGFLFFFATFLLCMGKLFWMYVSVRTPDTEICAALGASLTAFTIYRTTLSQTDSITFAFVLVGLTFAMCHIIQPKTARSPVVSHAAA